MPAVEEAREATVGGEVTAEVELSGEEEWTVETASGPRFAVRPCDMSEADAIDPVKTA